MEEIWKDIPNFNGYQASNKGRIRTHNKTTYTIKHGIRHWKDRILQYKEIAPKTHKSKFGTGYRVDLWKDGKPKTFLVCRLVATTFLENLIDTEMTVNHKDGNRLNNNIENLEWLTRKQNIQHGFDNNLYTNQKKTTIINKTTKEQKNFNSMSKASEFIGKNISYIGNSVLKNKFENEQYIWRINE